MEKGIQNGLLKRLSDYGCYFLCLIEIAERNSHYLAVDIVRYANECIENGWMEPDFTVTRPDLILGKLLEKKVNVISMSSNENPNLENANAIVNCWYNKRTGFYHFNLNEWDSLNNSVTVKEGKIVSYRIFSW